MAFDSPLSVTTSSSSSRVAMLSGARYMLLSAFFFSLMSVLVKVAGQRFSTQEIVLARAIVMSILSYWLIKRARISPWGHRRSILILRGCLGFVALMCFYFALTRLPIGEATVLHYTNPLFTALIAAWFLKERLSLRLFGTVVICTIGVTLVARPAFLFAESGGALDPWGVAAVLCGAVFAAAAYVSIRFAGRTEHPFVIVFYLSLVTVPLTIPLIGLNFVWPTGADWLVLLALGVVTQVAHVFQTRGLCLVPAGKAMAIGYTQILFAAVLGALLFAEFPGGLGVIGALLIIGGTLNLTTRGWTSSLAVSTK